MMRFAALAIVLPLLGPRTPQDKPEDIAGVREWWGHVSVKLVDKGSVDKSEPGGDRHQERWDYDERVDMDVHLNVPWSGKGTRKTSQGAPKNPPRGLLVSWRNDHAPDSLSQVARGGGTSSVTDDSPVEGETSVLETQSERTEMSRSGTQNGGTQEVILEADVTDKTYSLTVPIGFLKGHTNSVRITTTSSFDRPQSKIHESEQRTSTSSSIIAGLLAASDKIEIFDQVLPGGVTSIHGIHPMPLRSSPTAGMTSTCTVEWSFSPAPPPKIELEIEAQGDNPSDFESWRPRGGPDENTPGSHVVITARLVAQDWGSPPDRPRKIVVTLDDVSREPGLCMNYPPRSNVAPQPDLRFAPSTEAHVLAFDRRVSTDDRDRKELKVQLCCYDWGAYGEVSAFAELESGRVIQGHVKNRPADRTLRVPKRKATSRIAEVWNAPDKDNEDLDADPNGDGQKGDGFTDYEEYRGFYVQGAWTDGDPNKKELFVRNETGGGSDAGIALLEKLTDLRVHRAAADEIDSKKVVNFNRSGSGGVEQHGIRIVSDPSLNYCIAIGGPGLPKDITHVVLGNVPAHIYYVRDTAGVVTRPQSYMAVTVAHELLHGCNVWHHGDRPEEIRDNLGPRLWRKDAQGVIRENGVVVKVVTEAGVDVLTLPRHPFQNASELQLNVRFWRGCASGPLNCIMRYDDSEAYVLPASPNERRLIKDSDTEVTTYTLCGLTGDTDSAGGKNVRFGPCQDKRGNCMRQFVVNDAAKATPR